MTAIDVCTESPTKHTVWKNANKAKFPYEHKRVLPKDVAQRAIDYISVLVKPYPFQLQYVMARPLWNRFAQRWCETGNERKAMSDI